MAENHFLILPFLSTWQDTQDSVGKSLLMPNLISRMFFSTSSKCNLLRQKFQSYSNSSLTSQQRDSEQDEVPWRKTSCSSPGGGEGKGGERRRHQQRRTRSLREERWLKWTNMYIGCVQYVVPEKNVGGSDLHVIWSHLLSSRQQAVLTLNNFCYVHMFARGGKIVFVKVFIYFPQKVETDSHPIRSGNDGYTLNTSPFYLDSKTLILVIDFT